MKKFNWFTITVLSISIIILCIPYIGCGQNVNRQQQVNMELRSYSVHFVEGRKAYKYRDTANKTIEVKNAYLVFFDLANIPKAYGPVTDFYIGNYRIPEYGGTKSGIYFRIYDPKLLESLNRQPIYYSFGGERKPFNKQFTIANIKSMKMENEETLIRGKSK